MFDYIKYHNTRPASLSSTIVSLSISIIIPILAILLLLTNIVYAATVPRIPEWYYTKHHSTNSAFDKCYASYGLDFAGLIQLDKEVKQKCLDKTNLDITFYTQTEYIKLLKFVSQYRIPCCREIPDYLTYNQMQDSLLYLYKYLHKNPNDEQYGEVRKYAYSTEILSGFIDSWGFYTLGGKETREQKWQELYSYIPVDLENYVDVMIALLEPRKRGFKGTQTPFWVKNDKRFLKRLMIDQKSSDLDAYNKTRNKESALIMLRYYYYDKRTNQCAHNILHFISADLLADAEITRLLEEQNSKCINHQN
mgnify:CR=1 FL=1